MTFVGLRPAWIAAETLFGFLVMATVGETITAAVTGAIVAGVPTLLLVLKERRKDRATVRHMESADDLSYAEMVSKLLAEKAEWVSHKCKDER